MDLAFGILGFLSYAPMSGYDLAKAFDSSLKFFWRAQNSQIYLELKKLKKLGYVSDQMVVQSERPNKRLFSVTEEGRRAFLEWLAQGGGEEATQFKSAFLMKIFFGGNLPPAQSAAILGQFKKDCEAYLNRMDSVPESIERYGANKNAYQTLYWQFTADFGFRFIKLCIEWADDCIKRLKDAERSLD